MTAASKDDRESSLPVYDVNNAAAYNKAISEQALLDADAGSRHGFPQSSLCISKMTSELRSTTPCLFNGFMNSGLQKGK